MKRNPKLEARRKNISKDIDIFTQKSFDIADRIYELIQKNDMEQKELARLLGKKESEISKWLTGTHNFTLKTLSLIESVLQNDIFVVMNNQIQIPKTEFIYIQLSDFPINSLKKKNFVNTSAIIQVKESGYHPIYNAIA